MTNDELIAGFNSAMQALTTDEALLAGAEIAITNALSAGVPATTPSVPAVDPAWTAIQADLVANGWTQTAVPGSTTVSNPTPVPASTSKSASTSASTSASSSPSPSVVLELPV